MNGQTQCGGQPLHRGSLAANDNPHAGSGGLLRETRASAPRAPGFLHLRVIGGVTIQSRARATTVTGIYTEPAAQESDLFELRLHLKSGRSLVIGSHREDALIAEWRKASAIYGLPMLAREDDGLFAAIIPMFGSVQIGADRRRRRVAALTSRRPRFLTRRKMAQLPQRPAIHRFAPLGLAVLEQS